MVIKILTPVKYQNQIKSVTSIAFLVFIGSMLLKFDVSDLDTLLPSTFNTIYTSQENRLLIAEIESRISEYVLQELRDGNINVIKTSVETNIDEDMCISISEVKVTLHHSDFQKQDIVKQVIAKRIGDIDVKIEISED